MLVVEERGKPENPEKNLSEQRRGENRSTGEKPLGAKERGKPEYPEKNLSEQRRGENRRTRRKISRSKGEGKTGEPGEKPLGARERTSNKLNLGVRNDSCVQTFTIALELSLMARSC